MRCSENSVIFGRHAERSVTDEMSSFHSERLTPDNGQGEKDKEGRRGVADLTIFALRGFGTSSSAIKPRRTEPRAATAQSSTSLRGMRAGGEDVRTIRESLSTQ